MPVSTNLLEIVEIATSGTTATVSPQPSDNCHTITVFNQDTTNAALFAFVSAATALTSANAVIVPAGGAVTLKIGTAQYRPCGSFGGISTIVLRVKNNGAGTPTLSIQYLNSSAPTPP